MNVSTYKTTLNVVFRFLYFIHFKVLSLKEVETKKSILLFLFRYCMPTTYWKSYISTKIDEKVGKVVICLNQSYKTGLG